MAFSTSANGESPFKRRRTSASYSMNANGEYGLHGFENDLEDLCSMGPHDPQMGVIEADAKAPAYEEQNHSYQYGTGGQPDCINPAILSNQDSTSQTRTRSDTVSTPISSYSTYGQDPYPPHPKTELDRNISDDCLGTRTESQLPGSSASAFLNCTSQSIPPEQPINADWSTMYLQNYSRNIDIQNRIESVPATLEGRSDRSLEQNGVSALIRDVMDEQPPRINSQIPYPEQHNAQQAFDFQNNLDPRTISPVTSTYEPMLWIQNTYFKDGISRLPTDDEFETLALWLGWSNVKYFRRNFISRLGSQALSKVLAKPGLVYTPPNKEIHPYLISLHDRRKADKPNCRCHHDDTVNSQDRSGREQCPICPRTYIKKAKMIDHLLDQIDAEIFLCPFCSNEQRDNSPGKLEKVQTHSRRFVEHLTKIHKITDKEERDTIKKHYRVRDEDDKYFCPLSECPKSIEGIAGLRNWLEHIAAEHSQIMNEHWLDHLVRFPDRDHEGGPTNHGQSSTLGVSPSASNSQASSNSFAATGSYGSGYPSTSRNAFGRHIQAYNNVSASHISIIRPVYSVTSIVDDSAAHFRRETSMDLLGLGACFRSTFEGSIKGGFVDPSFHDPLLRTIGQRSFSMLWLSKVDKNKQTIPNYGSKVITLMMDTVSGRRARTWSPASSSITQCELEIRRRKAEKDAKFTTRKYQMVMLSYSSCGYLVQFAYLQIANCKKILRKPSISEDEQNAELNCSCGSALGYGRLHSEPEPMLNLPRPDRKVEPHTCSITRANTV